ncbi:hypothetical protein Acsp02_90970 [Actinoplanes sp. NBRC 103695]|nr:hypothetical protein Acsp02_90970 [Actinoplanes sp. NBRC 103695]
MRVPENGFDLRKGRAAGPANPRPAPEQRPNTSQANGNGFQLQAPASRGEEATREATRDMATEVASGSMAGGARHVGE